MEIFYKKIEVSYVSICLLFFLLFSLIINNIVYAVKGISMFDLVLDLVKVTNWFADDSFVENAYYFAGVSTPFLIIIAYLDLRRNQIDSDYKRKREKAQDTINICQVYNENIVIEISEIIKKLELKNIDYSEYNESLEAFEFTNQFEKYFDEHFDDEDLYKESINLLNSLEAFALNFTRGHCELDIVKNLIANTYLEGINQLRPFILLSKKDDQSNYNDIIGLYNLLKVVSA